MTLDEEFADIVFLRDLVIVNIVALANVLLKGKAFPLMSCIWLTPSEVLTRYWKEPELDQEILNNTFNHINQSRESVDLLIPNIPKETAGTDPFDLDSAINEVNLRTNSLVELSVVIGRAFKGRRNPNQAPIQIFNLTGDDPIIICKLVIKWIFPKATDTFTQEMAKSSWCKIKELHFRGNAPQEDLEHYICCFRNCERRPVGFDTFENWKYHVQQHCNSVREEECPACLKHSFEDMNSFTTHVGKHFVSIFQLIMKLALRPLPRDTVDDNHTCAVMIWNRIAPGHKCIRAKLDTGSDINMISLDLVKACDLEVKRLSQCKSQIVTWLNESKITLRYIVRLHWNSTTWRKTYSTIKFYVVKKLPYDMILGGDFVKARYPQKRVLVVHGDRRKSKEEKEREKKRHDEQKAAGEERRKEREERIKANRAGDSSNSNSNDSHSNDRQQST
ncbi:MAG: hypothetical protein M1834_007201 [Cirrosporium novae-zelandiae]|nr:MAG: hypothetical protein M1834_007201 [Cirrosporium novae-zelandiae]